MNNGMYESRKEQCEAIAAEVRDGDIKLRQGIRDACMIGAAEARSHALEQIEIYVYDDDERRWLRWPGRAGIKGA